MARMIARLRDGLIEMCGGDDNGAFGFFQKALTGETMQRLWTNPDAVAVFLAAGVLDPDKLATVLDKCDRGDAPGVVVAPTARACCDKWMGHALEYQWPQVLKAARRAAHRIVVPGDRRSEKVNKVFERLLTEHIDTAAKATPDMLQVIFHGDQVVASLTKYDLIRRIVWYNNLPGIDFVVRRFTSGTTKKRKQARRFPHCFAHLELRESGGRDDYPTSVKCTRAARYLVLTALRSPLAGVDMLKRLLDHECGRGPPLRYMDLATGPLVEDKFELLLERKLIQPQVIAAKSLEFHAAASLDPWSDVDSWIVGCVLRRPGPHCRQWIRDAILRGNPGHIDRVMEQLAETYPGASLKKTFTDVAYVAATQTKGSMRAVVSLLHTKYGMDPSRLTPGMGVLDFNAVVEDVSAGCRRIEMLHQLLDNGLRVDTIPSEGAIALFGAAKTVEGLQLLIRLKRVLTDAQLHVLFGHLSQFSGVYTPDVLKGLVAICGGDTNAFHTLAQRHQLTLTVSLSAAQLQRAWPVVFP